MTQFFRSIYFKLVLVGLLAILPTGYLILYNDYTRLNRLLDQQMQELFRQVGAQIMTALPVAADLNERFEPETRRILTGYNSVTSAAQLVQAALYKKVADGDHYRLTQNVQVDKASSVALLPAEVFQGNDFSQLRRIDPMRYKIIVPIPTARNPDYILFLQGMDETRPAYILSAVTRQGLFLGVTFLLFLIFVSFVIQSDVRIPLRHLKNAFAQKRKAALDPADFGEFGDLVRAIEDFRHAREEMSADQLIDPVTGFPAELAAQKIYEDARSAPDETYIVFFKVNYAEDYVKAFGRANRGVIKKMAAEVLEAVLPRSAPRAVTEDFFFVAVLPPKEFRSVVDRSHRRFNQTVLSLYELGQGKQVPIQTFSAFAVSSRVPELGAYVQALDAVESNWSSSADPHRGGWAILEVNNEIERSSGEPGRAIQAAAASSAPAVSKTPAVAAGAAPADSMDPVLGRKMFIVKLCRLSGIKPRLAAQVYSAGWHRPDLLLQTKIQDLSAKAGLDAQEASALIAQLRKFPREKLEYGQEDMRDVFVTDVRMIRKIPKESAERWFAAGFRRIEDLMKTSPDDLMKLDEAVSREDINAVLDGIRGAAAK